MSRPITDILREMRRGKIVAEASDELAKIVQAVDDTGKAGKLTLTLTVKPAKDGGLEKTISCDIGSTVPRHALPDSVFFSTGDGDLVRTDPDQREMFSAVQAGVSEPGADAQTA